MKATKLLMVLLVLCMVSGAFAQMNLSVVAGYAMSAFEDQESAAGTIPVGIRVAKPMNPKVQVGVEVLYPIGGFTFEEKYEYFGYSTTVETTINQMLIGAFGKMVLGEGDLAPFAKAGVGMYMGNGKWEAEGDEEDFDIDSGFGFNVGGGVNLPNKPLYVEFNYHIVSRKVEGADDSQGANFWNIVLGYNIGQ